MQFLFKVIVSAVIISLVSEISKRSSSLAALLISIPLTSIIALTWIYVEQKDVKKIASMSYDIIWLTAPSLVFFILLPFLLNKGMAYYYALLISIILTSLFYALIMFLTSKFGNL